MSVGSQMPELDRGGQIPSPLEVFLLQLKNSRH